MEKNKVVFLDRDGTINYDYGYVHEKNKLKFLPGVIEGLKKLQNNDYKLIIITNQSGIGRGYYTENEYHIFTKYMLEKLQENNIYIEDIYYCPHTEKDNCNCRKPKLKLFYDAIKDHNIDTNKSYVIGDKERDIAICNTTPITGILIYNKSNNYICKEDLLDAVNFIIEK